MRKKMIARLTAGKKHPVILNEPDYKIQFVQTGYCHLEGDQPIQAAVGFVSLGAARFVVEEAMSMFKKIKFPAAGFYLGSLTPFPVKALEAFAEKVEKIVVIESGVFPLLSQIVREKTRINPVVMIPSDGTSITALEIFEKEDWI